jgi:hypothetical protein
VIVLESTTYPGTTEEVILPRLESTGLKVGRDFFLGFSPERIDPGNAQYTGASGINSSGLLQIQQGFCPGFLRYEDLNPCVALPCLK